MLRTTFAIAVAALVAAGPAAAAPDPAFGQWLNGDGMGKVALGPCAGQPQLACGAITWLKDPIGRPTRDVHNPDKALRSRPLVGLVVIRGMKNAGPGRWTGGKLYDPESGKTYDGKLTALSTDRLQVKGCVLFVCDGQVWTRAGD
jgi:uncharacterized protein (DUF2147 family)